MDGLGDEQTVKGILVMKGQPVERENMRESDRQKLKAVRGLLRLNDVG